MFADQRTVVTFMRGMHHPALLVCRYDIETVCAQVDDYVGDVSACLSALRSGRIEDLLKLVKTTANTMNATSGQGEAEGLMLQSLTRLQVS